MKRNIELLLINSLAPRQRSISDSALENSLVIIRTYLEKQNISVSIVDPQRVNLVESGVFPFLSNLIRFFAELQMAFYSQGRSHLALLILFITWPFQCISLMMRKHFLKRIIKSIALKAKKQRIPFIGVKVWYGESYKWSIYLARKIRRKSPETIILAGGPQINVYGEYANSNNEFDLIISGPGEQILLDLIVLRRKVPKRHQFLRLALENNNGSSLFNGSLYECQYPEPRITIPYYKRSDLKGKIRFHTLADGFGCPWNQCFFCAHTKLHSDYQARNIQEIITEIKAMIGQGITVFRFSASDTPFSHGKEIANHILANNLQIRYSMFSRAVAIGPEETDALKLMIRSGLRAVFIGGETGHDRINQFVMNKGAGKKEIEETIKAIRLAASEVGISCRVGLAMIYPTPLITGVELPEVFQANMDLVKSSLPDTVIISPPALMPGTQWFRQPEQFGFHIGDDFIHKMMRYEYALYKPPEFWPSLSASLAGLSFKQVISETSRLRREIASIGIPTDLTDEYFLMTDALGYTSQQDLSHFKRESLKDILSGTATFTRFIAESMRKFNIDLAKNNLI